MCNHVKRRSIHGHENYIVLAAQHEGDVINKNDMTDDSPNTSGKHVGTVFGFLKNDGTQTQQIESTDSNSFLKTYLSHSKHRLEIAATMEHPPKDLRRRRRIVTEPSQHQA